MVFLVYLCVAKLEVAGNAGRYSYILCLATPSDSDSSTFVALRSEVFLEQPQNTTVTESYPATFNCSVVNSSFIILWRVNNSDATYTMFRERGVFVTNDPNDYTRSRLDIVGYTYNNNTRLFCGALQEHSNPQLAWIKSEVALLIIQGHNNV